MIFSNTQNLSLRINLVVPRSQFSMLHAINSLLLILQRTSFGTGVQSQRVKMEEGEVKLNLNVLDLPGFGDEIDNSRWLNDEHIIS